MDADQADGLERVNLEGRMGLAAAPVGRLAFRDVSIPACRIIGDRGAGFKMAMKVLDAGRIGAAAMGVGIGQAALEAARSLRDARA